jgi:hypothetical protein
MEAHINKDQFAEIYANNYEGETLPEVALLNAVEDYNGRVDNFLDALLEEVLEDAREASAEVEEAK